MEFPELGKHCSESSCKQLDFLPVQCDACKKIFCSVHYKYTLHNCPEAYKKDNQVPVCPLCNMPVSVRRGESPDVVVGQHIDNDCQSETAQSRRKIFNNKCALKGCKQKELMPLRCENCRLNFCLRHRNELDHSCQGFEGSGRGMSAAGAAAVSRSSAVNKSSSAVTNSSKATTSPQSSSILSSIGAQLNREREVRNGTSHRLTAQHAHSLQQPGLSEDEAIRRAVEMSLQSDSSKPSTIDSVERRRLEQEEQDAALARALQQSESEALATQNDSRNRQRTNSENKSCHIS